MMSTAGVIRNRKYLDTDVFNLFLQCFENANELFDYFSGTKYNSRKIIVLRNELLRNLEELQKIKALKELTKMIQPLHGKGIPSGTKPSSSHGMTNGRSTSKN